MRTTTSALLSALLLAHSSLATDRSLKLTSSATCTVTSGFNITSVLNKGAAINKQSYEFGYYSEALLEYFNPELAVFNAYAFPKAQLPATTGKERGLAYAKSHITTGQSTLSPGGTDSGAPATLGVAALLLGSGHSSSAYTTSAASQASYLLTKVERLFEGAISTRTDDAEAWAEWVNNAPPFLAYYAAATGNASLINDTVAQIGLYRSLLQTNGTDNQFPGAWEHVDSLATDDDTGLWNAGDGMAAYGITRVLATVMHWGPTAGLEPQKQNLVQWAKELVDAQVNGNQRIGSASAAAANAALDDAGLVRNYYVASNNPWYGDTTGTAIMAAAVYRLAVLAPDTFSGANYIGYADASRAGINTHVYSDGTLLPSVNPYNSTDDVPWSQGSPVGQAAGILMAAAYRDCVCAGVCSS